MKAITIDLSVYPKDGSSSRDKTFLSYYESGESSARLGLTPKAGELAQNNIYSGQQFTQKIKNRLTITGKNQGFKVYINEREIQSPFEEQQAEDLGLLTTGNWYLGAEMKNDKPHKGIKGRICGFQMWDYEMTEDQIQMLFSNDTVMRGNIFDDPPTYHYTLTDDVEYKLWED